MASVRLSASDRGEIRQLINEEAERSINGLTANDPEWESRVDDAARKKAIGHLGIDKELAELDRLDKKLQAVRTQLKELENQRDLAESKVQQKLPLNESAGRYSCPTRKTLCHAINDVKSTLRLKQMKSDKTGKAVLLSEQVRDEKLKRLACCVTREDVANAGILVD